jgi:pyruvate formate lyase activating enzyme
MTHVYGEVCAAHVDPIEKKPFYHFRPGTTSLSIATVGCNFKCGFCQNWQISQAARESRAAFRGQKLPPAEVVREAVERGCASISYTYTEPTIFFEYAYDTARLAKEAGLGNNFVTNGYMTAEALRLVQPYLDAANVDLKAFRDATYKRVCGARLEPVLATIRLMRELGVWVEVTTLVVPGLNDSDAELQEIAAFLAGVDRDIPWHISRFHPDYNYTEAPPTPMATLEKASETGKAAGLRYVYIGNVLGQGEDTVCAKCGRALIRRHGFFVKENRVTDGRCPDCGTPLAGVFK